MSKQSDAKTAQGYEPNPRAQCCMNCVHYRSEIVIEKGVFGHFEREKDKRCGTGGFAVKKTATCNIFQAK